MEEGEQVPGPQELLSLAWGISPMGQVIVSVLPYFAYKMTLHGMLKKYLTGKYCKGVLEFEDLDRPSQWANDWSHSVPC